MADPHLLKDINPGNESSNSGYMTAVGTTVYFAADDGSSGHELWKSDGTSAGTLQLRDINTPKPYSLIGRLTAVGSNIYFAAGDYSEGIELWKTDGTSAGTTLVKDLNPGSSESSDPRDFTTAGGKTFFTAFDRINGRELWATDGTAEGTVLIKDIWPGLRSSDPRYLTAQGNGIYFTAYGEDTGWELWRSDGTSDGTFLVKDINPGSSISFPKNLTVLGSQLFFSASNGGDGPDLWVSDGTSDGTTMLKDFSSEVISNYAGDFTVVGNTLFFTVQESFGGLQLWKSDGTPDGTILVRDLAGSGTINRIFDLTAVGNTLYFIGDDGYYGEELWKSDGSSAGTVLVKDISPGRSSFYPRDLISVGDNLYFTANDGSHGRELWKSDGTAAGTELVADILAGSRSSDPRNFHVFGNYLYFTADDGIHGREPWLLRDNQAPQLYQGIDNQWVTEDERFNFTLPEDAFRDPNADDELSYTANLANGSSLPDWLTFSGNTFTGTPTSDDLSSIEIEVTADDGHGDGVAKTTFTLSVVKAPVRDIMPGLVGSSPSNLTAVGSTLFFTAVDSTNGRELWKSDGTSAGTILVRDILPGNEGSNLRALTNVDDVLYFTADNGIYDTELWKSDGTESGTVLVKDINGSPPQNLTAAGNTLFFTVNTPGIGEELWKSNGTDTGTISVTDIRSGNEGSLPRYLTAVGDIIYFTADNGIYDTELWKSDGTESGTVLVKDINGSPPRNLTAVGNTLFFTVGTPDLGVELWKSNGTNNGTVLVKDISPGATGSFPGQLRAVNETLFFAASSGIGGIGNQELWKSDGTEDGTILLRDIQPGYEGSLPRSLTAVGNHVYFTADDGIHGRELWRSDGTQAGTVLLKDILPGNRSSNPDNLTVIGNTLFFAADSDGNAGKELWQSDGTEAGTLPVSETESVLTVGNLTHVGNNLFFTGTNGVTGIELFKTQVEGKDPETISFAEYGTLQLNHTWQSVNLTGSYTNPVVIAGDPSRNGADPVTVRLRNVGPGSFEMRLQEPNFMDGSHTNETVSWLVMEAGQYELADGTRLSASTTTTNLLSPQGFKTVGFNTPFAGSPTVLSQIQTFNGADWAITRTDAITGNAFQLTMQEEEKLNGGSHAPETIGWLAIDPSDPSGTASDGDTDLQAATSADTITHNPTALTFAQPFNAAPALIAKLSSFDGADPTNLRVTGLSGSGYEVIAAEEQSLDVELNHTSERASWLALEGPSGTLEGTPLPPPTSLTVGEYGIARLNHTWQTVTLTGSYTTPVVIAGDPSRNGADPATVRVRNAGTGSFEMRLQEPNHLDGSHTDETVSWLVMEAGDYQLLDGTRLSAGTTSTDLLSPQGFETVTYGTPFAGSPTVLSQIQTFNGADWAITRTDAITGNAFQLTMQEEEALNSGGHATETIGWLAIEPGSASDGDTDLQAGTSTDSITHNPSGVSFAQPFSSAPALIAKISSFDGADPTNLRYSSLSGSGFTAIAAEEQSLDAELNHTTEQAGWLALAGASGTLEAFAV